MTQMPVHSDRSEITQTELQRIFEYKDGHLYWKVQNSRNINVGSRAGSLDNVGYYKITIKKKNYRAHRLVFLFHHGYLPQVVAHDDGNRANNKIENLKSATFTTNNQDRGRQKSNTTGYKGVFRKGKKFGAQIRVDGELLRFGRYETLEAAARVYDDLVEKYVTPGFRVYNFSEGRPR